MCRTLVHELRHEQPKTTKEILDIATRHASSEEVVGAAFVLGNVKVAPRQPGSTIQGHHQWH
jgi:hypothetical protein